MASYTFEAEHAFQLLAGIPVLLLGLYVYKSNSKDVTNRVFALLCTTWTAVIVAINLVALSGDAKTADLWNRFYVYAQIAFFPVLVHFALIFPYRSRLTRRPWIMPMLYGGALLLFAAVVWWPELIIQAPFFVPRRGIYSANYRPSLFFLLSATLTLSVLIFLARYVMMDLDVTRKRLYFVTFGLSTFALYNLMGNRHLNAAPDWRPTFVGEDETYWQLTLAADYLLLLGFFGLLGLLALRTRIRPRRNEALALLACGIVALVTGLVDEYIRDAHAWYPSTLFLWRLAAIGMMFYAILRYQLFDLHVRLRVGVRYSTLTALFAAVFFTVQELVKDLFGEALGYFTGLVSAAALVFLFTPLQRLIERFSKTVVAPAATENYERYRSMEIYRAALEGALVDQVVSPAELHSLRNLRAKMGITDADHELLERDVRAQMGKVAA